MTTYKRASGICAWYNLIGARIGKLVGGKRNYLHESESRPSRLRMITLGLRVVDRGTSVRH